MSELSLPLSREAIQEILPHREPFLLLDEIMALEPGVSAEGTWTLTGEEYFFQGHFPGQPILPGVLITEALAQCGAVCILCLPENRGKLALFAGIDSMRFKQIVRPGDTLHLSAAIEKMKGLVGVAKVTATVGGKRAAYGKIMFALQ